MCNKAKQQSAHLVGEWVDQESLAVERDEVLLITVERVRKKLLARVQFCIEGRFKMVVCQLDTAAPCNVMSMADYNKLGCPKLTTSNVVLTMYDGTVKKINPWVDVVCRFQIEQGNCSPYGLSYCKLVIICYCLCEHV